MLLTLLALALSTAGLANQIRYNTGVPANQANVTMTPFAAAFAVSVICPTCSPVAGQISPVEISLMTSTLASGCSSFCTFSDGTATVDSLGGVQLFTDTVSNGTIIAGSIIMADLDPNPGFNAAGGSVHFGITFDSTRQVLVGNGSMILDGVIPEPGTLSLLGTGLICLGGMATRKLKLGA